MVIITVLWITKQTERRICLHPQNRTRISTPGLLAPKYKLSPLQHQSAPTSAWISFTNMPWHRFHLTPFILMQAGCLLNTPVTLSICLSTPPLVCCHLSTLPPQCCCCHFLPTCAFVAPPSPPYNWRHRARADISNKSPFPEGSTGSRTRN